METKVYFIHFPGNPIIKPHTICGISDGTSINIATSICSNKDQFEKAKGRLISEGRARKNADWNEPLDEEGPIEKLKGYQRYMLNNYPEVYRRHKLWKTHQTTENKVSLLQIPGKDFTIN